MKKIGVITITGESNYGNALQNYAVIEVLKRFNFEVYTINSYYNLLSNNTKMSYISKIPCYLSRIQYFPFFFLRRKKFKEFSSSCLNKTIKIYNEKYPEINNEFDVLVFGSDQIWNFTWGGRICDNFDYYTGNFAPNIKKVAFSASIGADYIPKEYVKRFADNIKGFESISVREKKAKEIIKEIAKIDVEVTVDPTLMLNETEWSDIANKPHYKTGKKFVLTYFLGNIDNTTKQYIKNVAEHYNLKVVNLTSEAISMNQKTNPAHFGTGPREFVWLVQNCEILFTDSFHGAMFSVLFNKPFRFFNRAQKNMPSMLSRTKVLFNELKIDDWCLGNTNEDISHVLYKNYSATSGVLEQKRNMAWDYLKGALNVDET